ncbi:hypothetical protein DFJ77DRAFT_106953 [Powellomyces hirtus]|nr:hypothetical protein DFJ77DRAFT_106953 [Powellomyces hirtus]
MILTAIKHSTKCSTSRYVAGSWFCRNASPPASSAFQFFWIFAEKGRAGKGTDILHSFGLFTALQFSTGFRPCLLTWVYLPLTSTVVHHEMRLTVGGTPVVDKRFEEWYTRKSILHAPLVCISAFSILMGSFLYRCETADQRSTFYSKCLPKFCSRKSRVNDRA